MTPVHCPWSCRMKNFFCIKTCMPNWIMPHGAHFIVMLRFMPPVLRVCSDGYSNILCKKQKRQNPFCSNYWNCKKFMLNQRLYHSQTPCRYLKNHIRECHETFTHYFNFSHCLCLARIGCHSSSRIFTDCVSALDDTNAALVCLHQFFAFYYFVLSCH